MWGSTHSPETESPTLLHPLGQPGTPPKYLCFEILRIAWEHEKHCGLGVEILLYKVGI